MFIFFFAGTHTEGNFYTAEGDRQRKEVTAGAPFPHICKSDYELYEAGYLEHRCMLDAAESSLVLFIPEC